MSSRRDFITLLGGAAAAWPAKSPAHVAAFARELQELGWIGNAFSDAARGFDAIFPLEI
jgi:hypothetical protein